MADLFSGASRAGAYATSVLDHLNAHRPQAFTVPELAAALDLKADRVRLGLDVLLYCREGAVRVGLRRAPHQRGTSPREYRAA